jgi:serine/threonine protein kinase
MVRVTRALIILKKLNYSHNDIKPENIFLSKNGEFKLGDLGACD